MIIEFIIGLVLAFLATCALSGCTLGVTIDRIKEGSEIQTTYRRDRYMLNEVKSGRQHDYEVSDKPRNVYWRNYEK